jgi:hypothetical protein
VTFTTTFALDPETGEPIGDPLSEEVTFLQPAFSVTVPHSARGPPYTTSAVVLASVLTRGRISASLTRRSVRSQRQEKGVEQAPGLAFCFGVPPLFPAALRQA